MERRMFYTRFAVASLFGLWLVNHCLAGDWPRFRGPNGSGSSLDAKSPPTEWSDTKNLKWKVELPGPGLSSPIVVGERIFLTCWSGYGVSRGNVGDQKNLKRHLVCVDRRSGKILWSQSVDPVLPEEPYRGMMTEHGYASHTPVSDGERVFVFFGKTGVLAFDLEGKKLWQTSVGTADDPRSWGTASSPILYKNLVIVPATIESQALIALDKQTGKEVWKKPATGFGSTWGTPLLVDLGDGKQDLVIGVPYEIWGFDPDNGKIRWYCETVESDSMCSSVIAHDGIVYAIEGRGGGAVAVRAGGTDDVTKTHLLWSGRDNGRIGTPVFHESCLYWVSGGVATCVDAKTGKRVYQSRLASAAGESNNTPAEPRGPGGGVAGGRDPAVDGPVAADSEEGRWRRRLRGNGRAGLLVASCVRRESLLRNSVRQLSRRCSRSRIQIAGDQSLRVRSQQL